MAITYSWNVDKLFTIDVSSTELSYVVTIFYSVIGTETTGGETYFSEIVSSAYFDVIPNQPNYIPYGELTEEIVLGWVKNQLGADGIASYEDSIAGQIQLQINPPKVPVDSPLPWETN